MPIEVVEPAAGEWDYTLSLALPITGRKVRLRPVRQEDAAISVHWRNDPEIRDNALSYRLPVTLEMEEHWTKNAKADPSGKRIVLAVEDECDKLIGYVYLNEIAWEDRIAELGIMIGDRSCHRRGYGTEATSLLIDYAFQALNLRRLFLRVVAYNEAAINLYARLGFRREGVLQQHVFRRDEYHNVIIMGLLRENQT